MFLFLQGHWYNLKVRGGIHVDISRREDLLDRPVGKCYFAFHLVLFSLVLYILFRKWLKNMCM